MLPINSNPSLITNVDTPTLIPEATRTATETTPAASGSSIRGAFAGISASFTSMFSSARNSSRPASSAGAAQTTPLNKEQRMAMDKEETRRLKELMNPSLTRRMNGTAMRSYGPAIPECQKAFEEEETKAAQVKQSNLHESIIGMRLINIGEQKNPSATIIQSWARRNQAKQTLNGLKAEKEQATRNSLMSRLTDNSNSVGAAPLMLTAVAHNRPFGPERPLIITDFSHNAVFHPEFPLNRRINLPLQGLQALNALLAQQEETPNLIVRPIALDISNSNSVGAAPLMLTNFAHNDKIVTKNSQPRSRGRNLGAALMLSSAVAAATYIKNPEAAQLVLRQAGVALTRAIPVIGAAWHSLAQGARGRWAHLAPQFRPLIGAAWQSGQAGLRNTAFPLFQSISGALGRGWIQAASSARQIVPAVANHLGHATKAIKK